MSKRQSEREKENPDQKGDFSSQSSALSQMQEAMDELPTQIRQIQQRLDRLSASMGGVPTELTEKGAILAEVDTIQPPKPPKKEKPDWGLEADVRVGRTLRVVVYATFALGSVIDAPPEPAYDADSRLRRILDRGWMTQPDSVEKRSGRLKVEVHNIVVERCRIRGAPKDAERTMILSPEAGISIQLEDDVLSFDLAPVLVIKNAWEEAEIPAFKPMGDEIQLPLEDFEKRKPLSTRLSLKEQDQRTTVRLHFEPLRESK